MVTIEIQQKAEKSDNVNLNSSRYTSKIYL